MFLLLRPDVTVFYFLFLFLIFPDFFLFLFIFLLKIPWLGLFCFFYTGRFCVLASYFLYHLNKIMIFVILNSFFNFLSYISWSAEYPRVDYYALCLLILYF